MSATDTAVPTITEYQDHPVSEPRLAGAAPITVTHRTVATLAALGLVGPAFAIWSGIIEVPTAGVVAVFLSLAGLSLAVWAGVARTRRQMAVGDLLILVAALVGLVAWAVTVLISNPAYGTDEAAYIQYAAGLFLHGADPYRANLAPALSRFGVPIQYATYLMNGGIASHLGYPSWAVLFTAPFVLLTGGVQSVIVANVASAVAGLVLAFAVVPPRWRTLAVVAVVDYSIIFGYVVSGDIAIFAFPALVLVAWRWTGIGKGGRLGWRGVVGAAALGLAVSTTQLAWFIAPFVVAAIFICRRRELGSARGAGVMARYLAVAIGVFLAINAVFIVEGPVIWLKGVLGPLTQHAIPYGQGLIDLATFGGVGGGDLSLYTYGAVLVYLALLCAVCLRFDRLWRVVLILPAIALWFPTRSLAEYWMTLIAIWLVALVSASPPPPSKTTGRRVPGWSLAALGLPPLAMLCLACGSPSPLSMRVETVKTNGQFERVWQLRARVSNRSSRTVTPHYATDSIGQATSFWRLVSGPVTLAAHSSATVTLEAPNVGSMPGISARFDLEAVTARPETVSVAAPYTAESYVLRLSTTSFPTTPLGHPVHLDVQVRSNLGAPVRQAGVPVFLGQVIYGQDNLVPAEASINGRPQGQSPIEAHTNAAGVADFRIVESTQQGSPLYFQAWTTGRGGYPFGYSQIVSATWTSSG